jgi:hypothetical protein
MILRALAILAVVFAAPASASLYNWTSGDSTSTEVTTNFDLIATNSSGGDVDAAWRNITKFWFASDDTNAYFRIDLEGGPGTNTSLDVFESVLYAAYIDADGDSTTGGQGADWTYLYWDGTLVNGIDYIIDVHYPDFGGSSTAGEHAHVYSGNPPFGFDTAAYSSLGVVGEFDQTNHRIEWSAPLANFGLGDLTQHFAIYAATYDISGGGSSFDLAALDFNAAEAPIPASWLLLAPGLLLLGRFRRRGA